MSKQVPISARLALPRDVVTSTLVVYGGKGMGKTNLGSVLVEGMTKASLRWAVLDPLGVWWGLRHSADGKGPGIECLIVGGLHGDLPLEPTAGAVVADLVAEEEETNVVIDFSRKPSGQMWSMGEKIRFVTDYALRLFQRQGEIASGRRRAPLPSGAIDLAKCVGAWEQLTEEGRNVGLGVTFLTQRSARMNKSVSELADAMIAFRIVGPRSIEAVVDWLGAHVEKARQKEIIEQVRKLPVGEALVISPGWLDVEEVVPIRMRETFDSSATPKPGERRREPGRAAKPDLDKYKARMAETIERAKQEDPRELRRRIQELERAARSQKPVPVAAPVTKIEKVVERKEVPVLKDAQLKRLESVSTKLVQFGDRVVVLGESVVVVGREITAALAKLNQGTNGHSRPAPAARHAVPRPNVPARAPVRQVQRSAAPVDGEFQPTRSRTKILDALAFLEQVGVARADKTQLALLADCSPTSGGYFNNLGALRTAGFIDYPGAAKVALTAAGRALADPGDVPQTTEQLHRVLFGKLTGSQVKILEALIEVYPNDIAKDQLAEQAGQSPTSGGYFNNLGRLRSLGLIDYPGAGRVVALPVLFLEGV